MSINQIQEHEVKNFDRRIGAQMIEKIETKSKQDVEKFYNNVFKKGGFISERKFNERILKILNLPFNKRLKLLDVGCGVGTLLQLAEKRIQTYGIDISKEAIKKAYQRTKNTEFRISSAEKLPFKNNYFDFITCLGSLEHFLDIDKALSEMKRILKPNGKIIIHVPNSFYLVFIIYVLRSGWTPTHSQINERFATRKEWECIIQKYFKIEKCYKYNTRWYLKWIPLNLCCHFTFLCRKIN